MDRAPIYDCAIFLAPFKRGPGLYFAISPSQHSVPACSWQPACLCLCLCHGCTVCCWLPLSCIDPSFGLHHSTTCTCYVLSPDAFTMKPARFSLSCTLPHFAQIGTGARIPHFQVRIPLDQKQIDTGVVRDIQMHGELTNCKAST